MTNYAILRNIYSINNDLKNELICSSLMVKLEDNDYESALFCAECSIALNKINDAFNYIKQFLDRIERNNYKDYKLDFLLVDTSIDIYERAKAVCDLLKKYDLKKEDVDNIVDKINKLSQEKIFQGVYSASGPGMFVRSNKWPEHLIKVDFPESISLSVLGDTADKIILKNTF